MTIVCIIEGAEIHTRPLKPTTHSNLKCFCNACNTGHDLVNNLEEY